MFNFTTTTIINSDKDYRSDKALFSAISADAKHGAILKIKRDYTFEMPYIQKVYKKEASEPTYAEVSIDCDNLIKALPSDAVYPVTGRINLYLALEGSEESIFANDFYQKGRPASVGFLIPASSTTGSELATAIEKTLKKFNVAMVGRKLFDVDVTGSVLTFKCTDEYSRFKAVAILQDLGDSASEIAHLFDPDLDNVQDVITLVNRGESGFGTFRHLLKDVQLPTATNTGWLALRQADRIVPGALYNQYVIHYKAPSYTNPSLVAVGHETKTATTHSFWVRQEFAEAFEQAITEVVGSGPVKDDATAIFEEV